MLSHIRSVLALDLGSLVLLGIENGTENHKALPRDCCPACMCPERRNRGAGCSLSSSLFDVNNRCPLQKLEILSGMSGHLMK